MLRIALERLQNSNKKPNTSGAQLADAPKSSAPPKKKPLQRINTISGGERLLASASNRGKKHIARMNDARLVASVQYAKETKTLRMDWEPIVFQEDEGRHSHRPYDDPLVIEALLDDEFQVERIFVDGGSAVNIMFVSCYDRLKISKHLHEGHAPLSSAWGHTIQPRGSMTMEVQIGAGLRTATSTIEFLLVDAFSPYNIIFGRPAINQFGLIPSGRHMLIKFPTPHGRGTIKVCPHMLQECADQSSNETHAARLRAACNAVATTDPDDEIHDTRFCHPAYTTQEPANIAQSIRQFNISDQHPERKINIGVQLSASVAQELEALLKEKAEVFAWSYADMPGISPHTITHKLTITPTMRPIRQRKRIFEPRRIEVINNQVDKLLEQHFIWPVHYPTWLSNPVLVEKPPDKWRMCIDYTNLNKACTKDSFPLPRIDALVDATAGHALMSMMDAYSGYNQIRMEEEDAEATAFMTDRGLYCWQVMSFGLKNAGATYQRLMTTMFAEQLGKEIEVYVDDMLVKNTTESGHVRNLRIILDILIHYKMLLNPLKCYFGVTHSKFLGYMISERGVDANPEKVQAIMNMEAPRTKKEIQVLDGRLASLSRFIARLTDKCKPFFACITLNKTTVAAPYPITPNFKTTHVTPPLQSSLLILVIAAQHKLAVILDHPQNDAQFLLVKQTRPPRFDDVEYGSFVDSDLWDLPSAQLNLLATPSPSSIVVRAADSSSAKITLTDFDLDKAFSQILELVGIEVDEAGEWRLWKYVEEPQFGPGRPVNSVFLRGKLVSGHQNLLETCKWMSVESCLSWLQEVQPKSERVGLLVVAGLESEFAQTRELKIPMNLSYQEYPPGVVLVPMGSRTARPFVTTNLVVFAPKYIPNYSRENGFVACGDALIVDPGCRSKFHKELRQIVAGLPRKLVVFVTHHHHDHVDGLAVIQQCNPEATLLAHENTMRRIRKDDWSLGYTAISGTEKICIGGQQLTAVFSPGHTDGHMGLLHASSNSLIVGDHCVGQGSAILDVSSGGKMTDFFQSTYKFMEIFPHALIPMHGRVNLWPNHMLYGYLKNRRARESSILKAIENGAETLFDIVATVYSDVDCSYWYPAASNVRLHVDHLADQEKLPKGFSIQKFQKSCKLQFFFRLMWAYVSNGVLKHSSKRRLSLLVAGVVACSSVLYMFKRRY